jgi:mannose-1-phosphate guanylyltransferase
MFVWRVDRILGALKKWLPDLYEGLLEIEPALGSHQEKSVVDRVYEKIQSISIDYGVMEKAENVLLVRGDFGWSDMGCWDALWEVSEKDEHGNATHVSGNFVGIDTRNSLIHSQRKLVALVGV